MTRYQLSRFPSQVGKEPASAQGPHSLHRAEAIPAKAFVPPCNNATVKQNTETANPTFLFIYHGTLYFWWLLSRNSSQWFPNSSYWIPGLIRNPATYEGAGKAHYLWHVTTVISWTVIYERILVKVCNCSLKFVPRHHTEGRSHNVRAARSPTTTWLIADTCANKNSRWSPGVNDN